MADPKTVALDSFRLIETGDPVLARRIVTAAFVNPSQGPNAVGTGADPARCLFVSRGDAGGVHKSDRELPQRPA